MGTSATNSSANVNSGASLQLAGGITLPGYGINIAGVGATAQDGALVNVSGSNTIQGLLSVTGNGAGNTSIGVDAGTLTFAGGINTQNNNITLNGAGSGVFANSGSVTIGNSNIYKEGSGSFAFLNNGTTVGGVTTGGTVFTGNLHLDVGTVSFANGGLGTPTINADGGVLQYAPGNTQDVSGVANAPVIQYGNGPIIIDTNGNTVIFNGTLSNNNGSRALTKIGAGALILNANTAYGDNNATQTSVLAGSLIVNGSTPGPQSSNPQYGSAVSVGDGINANTGVLAGTGTIGSPLTVQLGGTISAGTGATSSDMPGTLHLNGATFNGGGTYAVKIGASGVSDELITNSFTGPMSGQFLIQVTGTGSSTYTAGQQYVIVDDMPAGTNPFVLSSFTLTSSNSLPASDFSLSTTSDNNGGYELILTDNAVPEPASLMIVAPIAAFALGRRKRRAAAASI